MTYIKKLLLLFLAAALVLPFCACEEKIPDEIRFTESSGDWMVYDTSEKLVEAASDVYEGRITSIFFDVFDINDDPNEETLKLHTIYEVDVTKLYKGKASGKTYICVMSGLKDYKVVEQYNLLKEYGLYKERTGIPIRREYKPLSVGEKYLFCMDDHGSKYQIPLNPTQFATPLDSELAKEIREYFEKD